MGLAAAAGVVLFAIIAGSGKKSPPRPPLPPGCVVLTAWWGESRVTLPKPVKTPFGSRVSVVTACIDIYFTTAPDGGFIIHRVELSRGASLEGHSLNVASVRGEAWAWEGDFPEDRLRSLVSAELQRKDQELRKRMAWKAARPNASA